MARREHWQWSGLAGLVVAALILRLWLGGEVPPAAPPVDRAAEQLAAVEDLPPLRLGGAGAALPMADELDAPAPEEEAPAARDVTYELDSIREAIERYVEEGRLVPVGGNAAWSTVLTGAGPGAEAFLPPDHASIGPAGLLVDPWGSAFLFQAINAESLEIRSSGPDRVFQTADDLGLVVPLTLPAEPSSPPLGGEEVSAEGTSPDRG